MELLKVNIVAIYLFVYLYVYLFVYLYHYIRLFVYSILNPVIRRLEIRQLEQQCWRYLMTALSDQNCEFLHEIADRCAQYLLNIDDNNIITNNK